MTVSPSCLSSTRRRSALIGSLCVPSPSGMKELRKSWPSTVPATLTRPRVPKNSARPVSHDIGPAALGRALVQPGGEGPVEWRLCCHDDSSTM